MCISLFLSDVLLKCEVLFKLYSTDINFTKLALYFGNTKSINSVPLSFPKIKLVSGYDFPLFRQ